MKPAHPAATDGSPRPRIAPTLLASITGAAIARRPVEFVKSQASSLANTFCDATATAARASVSATPRAIGTGATVAFDAKTLAAAFEGGRQQQQQQQQQQRQAQAAAAIPVSGEQLRLPSPGLCPSSAVQSVLQWLTMRGTGAGLSNLGNTCFMNATLQCLLHIPAFVQGFESGGFAAGAHARQAVEGFAGKNVASIFRSLVQQFWDASRGGGRHSFVPKEMAFNLRAVGRQFRLGRQEDAHEFFTQLLDRMRDSELRAAGIDPDRVPSDKQRLAQTTFVDRVFRGFLRNQMRCPSCSFESNTYDPFLGLPLSIMGQRTNSVKSAIESFTQVETLGEGNEWRCERCKKKVRATKQMTVHKAPPVLAIMLKRFEFAGFGRKISKDVSYRLQLRVPVSGDQREAVYRLTGVLVHAGSTIHSGHYFSYVQGANGSWTCMDDDRVSRASVQEVLSQQAYILIYSEADPATAPTPALAPAPAPAPAPAAVVRAPLHVPPKSVMATAAAVAPVVRAPTPVKPQPLAQAGAPAFGRSLSEPAGGSASLPPRRQPTAPAAVAEREEYNSDASRDTERDDDDDDDDDVDDDDDELHRRRPRSVRMAAVAMRDGDVHPSRGPHALRQGAAVPRKHIHPSPTRLPLRGYIGRLTGTGGAFQLSQGSGGEDLGEDVPAVQLASRSPGRLVRGPILTEEEDSGEESVERLRSVFSPLKQQADGGAADEDWSSSALSKKERRLMRKRQQQTSLQQPPQQPPQPDSQLPKKQRSPAELAPQGLATTSSQRQPSKQVSVPAATAPAPAPAPSAPRTTGVVRRGDEGTVVVVPKLRSEIVQRIFASKVAPQQALGAWDGVDDEDNDGAAARSLARAREAERAGQQARAQELAAAEARRQDQIAYNIALDAGRVKKVKGKNKIIVEGVTHDSVGAQRELVSSAHARDLSREFDRFTQERKKRPPPS
jgi:ubiquitin C-terminal hydrolase